MNQADDIRAFVLDELIRPARAQGRQTVVIRAGDVHRSMGLMQRQPVVCSVLRGSKVSAQAGVTLIGTEGPANGANVYYRFRLDADRSEPEVRPAPRPKAHGPAVAQRQVRYEQRGALFLVSCTKAKRGGRMAAGDLYSSPAFRMKRRLIERLGGDWRILSAKHGLLVPGAFIDDYDETLTAAGRPARKLWASKVLTDLLPVATKFESVVMLAGASYSEYLIEPLRQAGVKVEQPLAGLRQGEQLAWLVANQ